MQPKAKLRSVSEAGAEAAAVAAPAAEDAAGWSASREVPGQQLDGGDEDSPADSTDGLLPPCDASPPPPAGPLALLLNQPVPSSSSACGTASPTSVAHPVGKQQRQQQQQRHDLLSVAGQVAAMESEGGGALQVDSRRRGYVLGGAC